MGSPVEERDPLAAIRRQEEALAAASWQPLAAVEGVETAQVDGMTVARAAGSEGPVLWRTSEEWSAVETGDEGAMVALRHLVGGR